MMKIQFITVSEFDSPTRKYNLFSIAPLLWPILASHVPEKHKIIIQDEYYHPIDSSIKSDMAFFSVHTVNAPRTYQYAKKFKKNGAKIIYGGPHITALQKYPTLCEEPFEHGHADAIVVGEAEPVFPEIFQDYGRGTLKKIYGPAALFNIAQEYRIPKREIFSPRGVIKIDHLETSRGCPHSCSFCVNNNNYRCRSIESLEKEIQFLRNKVVFILDSNFGKNSKIFFALTKLFKKFHIHWSASIDTQTLSKQSFLSAAKDSHCFCLFVGFETINEENIKSINKIHNGISLYRQYLETTENLGIATIGSFIFGFDYDHPDVFAKTLSFCEESRLKEGSFHLLVPYPGTKIFDQFLSEKRLLHTNFPEDWAKYQRSQVVFSPKNMSVDELKKGYEWFTRKFYSYKSMKQRFLHSRSLCSLGTAFFGISNISKNLLIRTKGVKFIYS